VAAINTGAKAHKFINAIKYVFSYKELLKLAWWKALQIKITAVNTPKQNMSCNPVFAINGKYKIVGGHNK
jgi:hypothetical protein